MSPYGGDERVRTADPLLAKQVLSQLSYTPVLVKCLPCAYSLEHPQSYIVNDPFACLAGRPSAFSYTLKVHFLLLRKEVIQPHLPIRLPCYDFTPITSFTFGGVLLAVRLPTSGPPGSHGVTGGVYKARERIHRGMLIRDY